jgi:hypothetical protein
LKLSAPNLEGVFLYFSKMDEMEISTDVDMELDISCEVQLFPHSEVPLFRQEQLRPFLFTPVEKKIRYGSLIHIGRKIDRSRDPHRGTTREDRAAHNVSFDVNHMSGIEGIQECISFRSKVVSRHHCELWVGKDGVVWLFYVVVF